MRFEHSIRIGQERFFEDYLDAIFLNFVSFDTARYKSFNKYLAATFFGVKEPLAITELFKTLYDRFKRQRSNPAPHSIKSTTLLLRELKVKALSESEQRKMIKRRLKALRNHLVQFEAHYLLLHPNRERASVSILPEENSWNLPESLSEPNYDKIKLALGKQKTSPFRAIRQLGLAFHRYFLNATAKDRKSGKALAQLAHSLSLAQLMVGECISLEKASREKAYGPLAWPEVKQDEVDTVWLKTFGALRALHAARGEFDWPAYEACKQLIVENSAAFHSYNQVLLCEYIINYLVDGYKKGEGGMEAEQLFWLEFRVQNNLVTVTPSIAEGTFLNAVSTYCMNKAFPACEKFVASYLPRVVEEERQNAAWMAKVIKMFNQKFYLGTLEALEQPPSNHRKPTNIYTIRRMSLRLRAMLVIEVLHLESDLIEEQELTYEKVRHAFSTHLSDARQGAFYPDWYIKANQTIIKVCNQILEAHRGNLLNQRYNELESRIKSAKLLPIRSWYLDLLRDLID